MHIILGSIASFCLVVFTLFFALVTVGLFAGMAFALKKITVLIEKLTVMAEPVIVKTTHTLDTVQRITENIGEKADNILTKGEALTDSLTEKVEKTSTVVQETVTNPLINLSSMVSGMSKGFSVWGRVAANNAKKATHGEVFNGSNGTHDKQPVSGRS